MAEEEALNDASTIPSAIIPGTSIAEDENLGGALESDVPLADKMSDLFDEFDHWEFEVEEPTIASPSIELEVTKWISSRLKNEVNRNKLMLEKQAIELKQKRQEKNEKKRKRLEKKEAKRKGKHRRP